jgi:hypothetical protein
VAGKRRGRYLESDKGAEDFSEPLELNFQAYSKGENPNASVQLGSYFNIYILFLNIPI